MGSGPGIWRQRVSELVQAARDVTPTGPSRGVWTQPYRDLFEQYVRDLRGAKRYADDWWQAVVATEQSRAPDRPTALHILSQRFPLGPVGNLHVVGVVRQYWLTCASMNDQRLESERVPPAEFVLGHLVGNADEDLAEFLAGLPYWPIGMDADGNWV